MTLKKALRYVSIAAAVALLSSGVATTSLHAQGTGTPAANADGVAKKKSGTKKTTAKPDIKTDAKPQKPAQAAGQGYRPDPVTNY